jgi:hypothetical protein
VPGRHGREPASPPASSSSCAWHTPTLDLLAIDSAGREAPLDELALRRLKKRRLLLRDQIARLERMVDIPEPA